MILTVVETTKQMRYSFIVQVGSDSNKSYLTFVLSLVSLLKRKAYDSVYKRCTFITFCRLEVKVFGFVQA